MSFLKKVEVVALRKKRTKTVKPKSAKGSGENKVLPEAKKSANSFLKFMETFIGMGFTPQDFADGMLAVWKGKSNTRALREDPSGVRMAKVYVKNDFPDLIAFLNKVKSAVEALEGGKALPKDQRKKAAWEK